MEELTFAEFLEEGVKCSRVVGHPLGVQRPGKDVLLVQLFNESLHILGRACMECIIPVDALDQA